jgi:hypothetical protein
MGTYLTRSIRHLTKTVKPKLESSPFWCTQLKWGLQKDMGTPEDIV